jgi:hypothetical protein
MIHSGGTRARVAFKVCVRSSLQEDGPYDVVGSDIENLQDAIQLAKRLVNDFELLGTGNYVVEVRDDNNDVVWMREKITNYED